MSFPIKKKTPFIKQLITGKIAALAIYVDDIIVAMDDIEEMDKLKKWLTQEFGIKDSSKFKYFLGLKWLIQEMVLLFPNKSIFLISKKSGCSDINLLTHLLNKIISLEKH